MPPVTKKNASVILFDMYMKREVSTYILNKIITYMQFEKKNLCKVILLHASNPNPLNIEEIEFDFNSSDGNQFTNLIKEKKLNDANWVEGLEYATELFKLYWDKDPSIINRRIFFISDLSTPMNSLKNKDKRIDTLINKIYESAIYLYIFGPQIEYKGIYSRRDVKDVNKRLQFTSTVSDEDVVRNIIKNVEGIVCGPSLAIDFITFFCNEFPKQPWNFPLTIGSFEFPTVTKRVLVSNELSLKLCEKFSETKYIPIMEDLLSDSGMDPLSPEDVIKAYYYLNQPITLPDDVNESFKYKGNRMFKLIGFIKRDRLPEVYFEGGEAHRVEAIKDHPRSVCLNNLIQAAINLKMYGLALRSYNNNNAPRLYVLIPKQPHQFLMVPHAEKVEAICYPQDAKSNPNLDDGKVEEFSEYFKYLNSNHRPLNPSMGAGVFYNTYLDKLVERLSGIEVPRSNDSNNELNEKVTEFFKIASTTMTKNKSETLGDEVDEW